MQGARSNAAGAQEEARGTAADTQDSYRTIAVPAQAASRERSSKFLAYIHPVQNEEQIRSVIEALRKKHFDATHHCYAWRLGPTGEQWRAVDDGEPAGTAGRPILGQLLSNELTDCLVVVVRWFGGTKLGVPGLIAAYKEAACEAIVAAQVVERTVDRTFRVDFAYIAMNDMMRVVKLMQPTLVTQTFDNLCSLTLTIRAAQAEELIERLEKAGGVVETMDK